MLPFAARFRITLNYIWGPLCTQSAFGIESKNEQLKSLIHGTWFISYCLMLTFAARFRLFVPNFKPKKVTFHTMTIHDHDYYVVGQCKVTEATNEQTLVL